VVDQPVGGHHTLRISPATKQKVAGMRLCGAWCLHQHSLHNHAYGGQRGNGLRSRGDIADADVPMHEPGRCLASKMILGPICAVTTRYIVVGRSRCDAHSTHRTRTYLSASTPAMGRGYSESPA
jgi:hypothetical protein